MDNSPRQRLDVRGAAQALGITVDAVRKRIQRGQLESEKDESGRVWVWLDFSQDTDEDIGPINYLELLEAKDETINELRKEVDLLRQELERHGEEATRKDHIIMALTQRIPQLEPIKETSSDAPEPPITASEEEAKGEAPPEPESAKSEPWWRRIFR